MINSRAIVVLSIMLALIAMAPCTEKSASKDRFRHDVKSAEQKLIINVQILAKLRNGKIDEAIEMIEYDIDRTLTSIMSVEQTRELDEDSRSRFYALLYYVGKYRDQYPRKVNSEAVSALPGDTVESELRIREKAAQKVKKRIGEGASRQKGLEYQLDVNPFK